MESLKIDKLLLYVKKNIVVYICIKNDHLRGLGPHNTNLSQVTNLTEYAPEYDIHVYTLCLDWNIVAN